MDEKVNAEIAWDRQNNGGQILKGVMGIVLRHQPPEAEWTREEYLEIEERIGDGAEARIVEWRDQATAFVTALPDTTRRKLAWQGSDQITDIEQYRAAKSSQTAEQ